MIWYWAFSVATFLPYVVLSAANAVLGVLPIPAYDFAPAMLTAGGWVRLVVVAVVGTPALDAFLSYVAILVYLLTVAGCVKLSLLVLDWIVTLVRRFFFKQS